MHEAQIEATFLEIVDNDSDMSYGIAAIKTLLSVLEKTNCEFHNCYIDLLMTN